MPLRRLFALLTVVFAFATPAAALAQSAGDEQYVDPLSGLTQGGSSGGSQGSSGGSQSSGGSSQGSSGGSQSSSGTSAAPTAAAPAATGTDPAGTQSTLARTGVDLRLLAGLGLLLLLGGFALRRGAYGRR